MTAAFDMTIPAEVAASLESLHPDGAQHATAAAVRLYLGLGKLGLDALHSRAKHEGMKPAELILHLLANPTPTAAPTTPSATTMTPRPAPRHATQARDAQIAEEYFAGGVTYARLAAKHELSTVRIAQIIARARAQQYRI